MAHGRKFAIWEELKWDWVESLRGILRHFLLEMGEQSPSTSDLAAYALPEGTGGLPRLKFPVSFHLDDPAGYFQQMVLVRKEGQAQAHIWKAARLAHLATLKGGRAGREEDDAKGGGGGQRKPLGKRLTGAEEKAARAGIPTDPTTGKKFCLLFSCHGGPWGPQIAYERGPAPLANPGPPDQVRRAPLAEARHPRAGGWHGQGAPR